MLSQTAGKDFPKHPLELVGRAPEPKPFSKEQWEAVIRTLLGKEAPRKKE